ncbi:IS5 family transposase [Rhodobacteraceae bacterium F11138]|nr:IS5 family transposase [Rhodobacteraceae bacterium F11138]
MIWLDKDMVWHAPKAGRPGRPPVFSDAAIQFCLSIKVLFKLPLRQAAGMVISLLRLAGLDWPVPDYSTLCRRQKNLAVQIPYRRANGPLNLLVDSTGIKFLGDGEWQARKHGVQGRRQWRKVHLAKKNRKFKATTDSNHSFNIAPNLLNRDFLAASPNRKWTGDISYVWTQEGWLYLAVILDLHTRRVIGWAVSNRMKRNLAIRALDMAIALRRPSKGCIHHTDRGSQGGFKRSSQRFQIGGCDDKPQTRFGAQHTN